MQITEQQLPSFTHCRKRYYDPSAILTALAKLIGTLLGPGPGYQCKKFMLAFPYTKGAVAIGMLLQETLKVTLLEDESSHGLIQIGIHEGPFSALVPDKMTGRADYFGEVVNRAARVAGAAHPGTVVVAMVGGTTLPELGDGFDATFLGMKTLKGVQEEMALYVCSHDEIIARQWHEEMTSMLRVWRVLHRPLRF
jgi:class 3 adenylate cyclase